MSSGAYVMTFTSGTKTSDSAVLKETKYEFPDWLRPRDFLALAYFRPSAGDQMPRFYECNLVVVDDAGQSRVGYFNFTGYPVDKP